MMNKVQALSVVFAVALSSAASAGSITTSNGASCNDDYRDNQDTGRSFEVYADTNVNTNDTQIGFKYTIQLGKQKYVDTPITRLDCSRLYDLELQKQQLELQRLRAELAALKAAAKAGNTVVTQQDDW